MQKAKMLMLSVLAGIMVFTLPEIGYCQSFRQGDRGESVRRLQMSLNNQGYDVMADGVFGPATEAAIREYEKKNGLTVDGIAGEEVQMALFGELLEETKQTNFVTEAGTTIVKDAQQYLGVPYVYGGAHPSEGFDCSGFVYYVFGKHGIRLPRTADDQYLVGVPVKGDLQPGDLVFFSADGYEINHVGIYVGNHEFIHANSEEAHCIDYDSMTRDYRVRTFAGAKRFV